MLRLIWRETKQQPSLITLWCTFACMVAGGNFVHCFEERHNTLFEIASIPHTPLSRLFSIKVVLELCLTAEAAFSTRSHVAREA